MARYFEEIAKYSELAKPVVQMLGEHVEIGTKYRSRSQSNFKWRVASRKAIESGKTTEEERKAFFEFINKELANAKKKYKEGLYDQWADTSALSEEGPLSFLITEGAFEFARAEKERVLTEEKTLDEAVELAKRRDSLVQDSHPAPQVETDEKDEEESLEDGEVK